jgi:hypothetical protein
MEQRPDEKLHIFCHLLSHDISFSIVSTMNSSSSSHIAVASNQVIISRNCFYAKQRKLESRDEALFRRLSNEAIAFVMASFVTFARALKLTVSTVRGPAVVTTYKDVLRHFRDLAEVSEQDQNDLSYIIDGAWPKFWEIGQEQQMMNRHGLVYQAQDGNSDSQFTPKGDVAKLLSEKKGQCVKKLRDGIVIKHTDLNIQIISSDGKDAYKRGRKEMGLTYLHPVKNKVRVMNHLFQSTEQILTFYILET